MSLGSLGRLGIEIYADTAQFTGDLGKVERAAASMGASITGSLGGVLKGLGALGIGLAAVDFVSKTRDALDHADALGKLAQKTGLAVDELSRYSYAAKLADVSNETLAKGIKGLSEKMVDANDANSESARLFRTLGVDINGGIGPAIEKLADQFAGLPDGATKTTLAVKLFGKAGQEMIPFLNGGADGIRRLKDEATALGIVIDKDTAAAAERFNDNMRAMKTGAESLGNTLATKTAAALADVTDAMKEAYKEGGVLLATWVALGGAASKIFTEDGLSEAEKATRRIAELRDGMATLRERMIAAQEVGDKFRLDQVIDAVAKSGKELQLLNEQLIALKRTEAERSQAAAREANEKKAREKVIKDQLALEEQRKKAEAETKAWNARLRAEDLKGWVAYADEQIKTYEAQLAAEAKDTEDFYREKDRMQQLDAKGWIAKIESDAKEYEDELRAMGKITEDFYREQDRIREQDTANQLKVYDELGTRLGDFFADMVVNGKSAFDRLRDSLKQFAAELIALFAKKWILNLVGNSIGGSVGQSLLALAGNSGVGSLAGSALSGLGSLFGGGATGGAGIWAGAGYGEAAAGAAGAAGGGIGSMFATALPWIAAIGAAYALIKKFGDKGENPKAQLGFGSGADAYVTQGVFGAEGFKSIQTDDAFNQSLRAYFASFKGMDEALAKLLNDSQQQRIRDALGSMSQREFAFPKGDGTAGEQLSVEYLKQKYGVIFAELDGKFAEFVASFTGSAADLQKAIAEEAAALEMLDSAAVSDMFKQIPDLTIEGLRKMQQAGEALSDTFGRVVNEFLTAQNNLNSAIAARNPQFARDLVLGQRNNLGAQFAASIGQSYDGNLAAQMALNPQSFTGLNTLQMGMLAQWLGLQTQLEQLDQQLAQGAAAATNVATSFNNAANAADDYAARLADSQSSLAGFLRGSIVSSSPLSASERYNEARRQLEQQFAIAEGSGPGALDARSGLGNFLQQFWDLSKNLVGSSGQGINDYWTYYNRAAALTGGQVQPYTRQDGVDNTQAVVAAVTLVAEQSQINASATIALASMLAEHGLEITSPTLLAALDAIRTGNTAAATGGVLS